MGSLRITAEALDVKLYQINYIHTIRWIASEHRALTRVFNNWNTLVTNMESIQSDSSDFDDESKNKAMALQKDLKSPRFLTTLVFLIDGLEYIQIFSKMLQEKIGVVIGKENERAALIKSIQKLNHINGPVLTSFINEVQCFKDLSWKKCKETDLDSSEIKIRYKNVDMQKTIGRHDSNKFFSLSSLRSHFSSKFSKEIETYFPEGDLKMFDPLQPSKIPVDQCEILSYGVQEIQQLAAFFKMDVVIVSQQWRDLLLSMSDKADETCRQQQDDNAVNFWGHFLLD